MTQAETVNYYAGEPVPFLGTPFVAVEIVGNEDGSAQRGRYLLLLCGPDEEVACHVTQSIVLGMPGLDEMPVLRERKPVMNLDALRESVKEQAQNYFGAIQNQCFLRMRDQGTREQKILEKVEFREIEESEFLAMLRNRVNSEITQQTVRYVAGEAMTGELTQLMKSLMGS